MAWVMAQTTIRFRRRVELADAIKTALILRIVVRSRISSTRPWSGRLTPALATRLHSVAWVQVPSVAPQTTASASPPRLEVLIGDVSRKRKRASDATTSLRTTRHAKPPQKNRPRITAGKEDASSDVLVEIAPLSQPCHLPEHRPRSRWLLGPTSASWTKARLWAGTFGTKEEESSKTGDFG